jgi:hypothetical protein
MVRGRRRLGIVGSALLAAVLVLTGGDMPARAVTPDQVVTAAKLAYEAYQKLYGGQLTLEQAKTQIIDAIRSAQAQIIAHIDAIAAANVRACARSAVIDVVDIRAMTPDSLQAFARDATACVTLAEALTYASTDRAAIDQVGFALNTVGPIALAARAFAGLSTPATKDTLIAANNGLMVKLSPSCFATPLWGDAQGGRVEVELRCRAYNGNVGYDFVVIRARRGQPLPPFDYSDATTDAMRGTSYEVATAVLPVLAAVNAGPTRLPQSQLRVAYVDSQETVGEPGAATNAIDGDPSTIWHSRWYSSMAPMPHEIRLDLGASFSVTKLYYLPRQNTVNGWIVDYQVYISADGTNWGAAVATGSFARTTAEQAIAFAAKTGRYVRLRALNEINGNPWTCMAELGVGVRLP